MRKRVKRSDKAVNKRFRERFLDMKKLFSWKFYINMYLLSKIKRIFSKFYGIVLHYKLPYIIVFLN